MAIHEVAENHWKSRWTQQTEKAQEILLQHQEESSKIFDQLQEAIFECQKLKTQLKNAEARTRQFEKEKRLRVPKERIPALAKIIAKAGPASISAIVADFNKKFPDSVVPKTRLREKINQMGVREKRPGDAKTIWHVRDAYQK